MASKPELESRVVTLETKIDEKNRELASLREEITRLTSRNSSLETDLNDARARESFIVSENERLARALSSAGRTEGPPPGDAAALDGVECRVLFRGYLRDVSDQFKKNNYSWEKTALILDRDGE